MLLEHQDLDRVGVGLGRASQPHAEEAGEQEGSAAGSLAHASTSGDPRELRLTNATPIAVM
jgi:hypothetical protein